MKNSYQSLLVILAFVVALPGCTGAALRGGMTESVTYRETLDSAAATDAGNGRVFVYIPKGGPDIKSTLGVIDFFSIDKDIYRFGGESYFYFDIEAGAHSATVTEVVKAGLKNKKQYGKSKASITISEGAAVYLRITAQKARTYTLEVVSKAQAEKELEGLPLWTNSATTMKIE